MPVLQWQHIAVSAVAILLLTCHVDAEARGEGKQEGASTPASAHGYAHVTTAAPTCPAANDPGQSQQQQCGF